MHVAGFATCPFHQRAVVRRKGGVERERCARTGQLRARCVCIVSCNDHNHARTYQAAAKLMMEKSTFFEFDEMTFETRDEYKVVAR